MMLILVFGKVGKCLLDFTLAMLIDLRKIYFLTTWLGVSGELFNPILSVVSMSQPAWFWTVQKHFRMIS
jgi:hypothetical protein